MLWELIAGIANTVGQTAKGLWGYDEVTKYSPTDTFYGNFTTAGTSSSTSAGIEHYNNMYKKTEENDFGKWMDILIPSMDTAATAAAYSDQFGIGSSGAQSQYSGNMYADNTYGVPGGYGGNTGGSIIAKKGVFVDGDIEYSTNKKSS